MAGTTYVTDSNDGVANFGIYPSYLTNANGTLYFTGLDLNDDTQVFQSNGTAAGTTMVADIPGANNEPGCYPSDFTVAGGILYFQAANATAGASCGKPTGRPAGRRCSPAATPAGAARSRRI